ncbi:MAG: hypothetical protein LBT36_01180, partial [Oscillospiraceae bacterium]|nr:hypothetical protein [Oscillospiraceae bacterium]
TRFVEAGETTVVFPVAVEKRLCWIDPETGEAGKKNKSPHRGRASDLLPFLFPVKPLLTRENLAFRVLLLNVTEYRWLNGWSRDRKRGSLRYDRVPEAILGETWIRCAADYAALLPETLRCADAENPFDAKTFAGAMGFRAKSRAVGEALSVLLHLDIVERVGKRGNAFLYAVRQNYSPVG